MGGNVNGITVEGKRGRVESESRTETAAGVAMTGQLHLFRTAGTCYGLIFGKIGGLDRPRAGDVPKIVDVIHLGLLALG